MGNPTDMAVNGAHPSDALHFNRGSTHKISKRYFSWEQIHTTVLGAVEELKDKLDPNLLVGISGGGLVPARMLRSGFKLKYGKTLPIQVVGAVHYDDDAKHVLDNIHISQWLSPTLDLSGARVLLVDEVDDSRKTLAFIVDEMLRFFDKAKAAHEAAGKGPWVEPVLGTFVIHNKVRPKEAEVDARVYPATYFAGEHTPNMWHVYPWDAEDIEAHTAMAHAQAWYFREKPGELEQAMAASSHMPPSQAASVHVHYADGGDTRVPKPSEDDLQLGPAAAPSPSSPISIATTRAAKSALTSALAASSGSKAAGSNSPAATAGGGVPTSPGGLGAGGGGQPQHAGSSVASSLDHSHGSLPRVNSGVWRASPDGLYFNYGYVPAGLAPRFGSLTLVEYGHLNGQLPPHRQQQATAAAAVAATEN